MAQLSEEHKALREILELCREARQDLRRLGKAMVNPDRPIKPTVSPEVLPSVELNESPNPLDLSHQHVPSSPMTLTIGATEPTTNSFLTISSTYPQNSVTSPSTTPATPQISPKPPDPPDIIPSDSTCSIQAVPEENISSTLSNLTSKTSKSKCYIPLKYSCEEIYQRMEMGLCIFCEEQDTPDHQLKHNRFQILVKECDDQPFEDEESLESAVERVIDSDETKEQKVPDVQGHSDFDLLLNNVEMLNLEDPIKVTASDAVDVETLIRNEDLRHLDTTGHIVLSEEMKVSLGLAANKMVEDSVDDHKVVKTKVQAISDQEKSIEVNGLTATCSIDVELQLSRKIQEAEERFQINSSIGVEVSQELSVVMKLDCAGLMFNTMSHWEESLRARRQRQYKWSKSCKLRVSRGENNNAQSLSTTGPFNLGGEVTVLRLVSTSDGINDDDRVLVEKLVSVDAYSKALFSLELISMKLFGGKTHDKELSLAGQKVMDRDTSVVQHTPFKAICRTGEAGHCVLHETKHIVSYVWHRWKNKAEIDQAVSVFILLKWVNSQLSDGYGSMIMVSWTLSEVVCSCYNMHMRVYFSSHWPVRALFPVIHDYTIWDCHHHGDKKLFLEFFVLNLVVKQSQDRSFFGFHGQWKWDPPEQFYKALSVVMLWEWLKKRKLFSSRWLIVGAENKRLRGAHNSSRKPQPSYLGVVLLKRKSDLHVKLKLEMFPGFLTKNIAEKEKHLVRGGNVASSKTATVHDEMVEAHKLIEPYINDGFFCSRSVSNGDFASLWKGNTTSVICYFTTQAWECAVKDNFQMSFSFKVDKDGFGNWFADKVIKAVKKRVADKHILVAEKNMAEIFGGCYDSYSGLYSNIISVATFVDECISACRILLGAFVINLLVEQSRDCGFSVLLTQWEEHPPDKESFSFSSLRTRMF